MRLIKSTEKKEISAISSQTELVEALSSLVSNLQASPVQPINDQELRESAIWALGAARTAERRIADQMERIAHLERLAMTDELTGLLNRRGFESELKKAIANAGRYGEGGVLIYVDLDGFKPINDTFGHAAGDEVLKRAAGLLKESVRPTDSVGRLGGDEFAALLVRSAWDDGLARATTIDRVLNSAKIPWGTQTISLAASLGVQAYSGQDSRHDLLKQADKAMYQCKKDRAQTVPLAPYSQSYKSIEAAE